MKAHRQYTYCYDQMCIYFFIFYLHRNVIRCCFLHLLPNPNIDWFITKCATSQIDCDLIVPVFLNTVDNIGLTCSVESMHTIAARRLSRRGTASRHHPHRTSSRRNKENTNGVHRTGIGRSGGGSGPTTTTNPNTTTTSSSTHHDDLRSASRKQRTVSFEQNQLQSPSRSSSDYFGPELAARRTTPSHWTATDDQTRSSHDIYNSAIHSSMGGREGGGAASSTSSIVNFMTTNSEEEADTPNISYQINPPFLPPRV